MDTLQFFDKVLPVQGGYFAVTVGSEPDPQTGELKRETRHFFCDTQEKLAYICNKLSRAGHNTYFATGAFLSKEGRRKQVNVRAHRSLFLDVDCGDGKPFPTWKEGLQGLLKFVTDAQLPKPMVIHSGNGLHVYWPLDAELPRDEWQALANTLKAIVPEYAGQDANGKPVFDPTVPADSARILRPVGTINPKGGRQVRLLIDAPVIPLQEMKDALARFGPTAPRLVKPGKAVSAVTAALSTETEFPPAHPATIALKCAQVDWAVKNQADVPEPMWYLMVGLAAYCENPEQTAIDWSIHHPQFDQNTTLAKLDQWKRSATGPSTCVRFAQERPGGCKECKFRDKIGSPARLGLQYQEKELQAPDPEAAKVPLPKGFKRTDFGIKMKIDDTDIDVCKFDVYPVSYGRDDHLGYETVRYKWQRPHAGWQPLVFRQAYLTEQAAREFAGIIADQGVVLSTRKQTELFQYMLRSYMDELRNLRSMTNLYATMGWKDNGRQFLVGETLLTNDPPNGVREDVSPLSQSTAKAVDSVFGKGGTPQDWINGTAVLEQAKMDLHKFAMCVSFSAPLYNFCGLKGVTINLAGPTGAGKTLAQLWMQSIWGDPLKLHYTAKFTQNALFSRMGLFNHLPVTIDEATMIPAKEIGDILYWNSQGRDKARLNSRAEERDVKTWATVVTMSANKSLGAMLTSANQESDAQMMRLLEINMHPIPLFIRSTEAGKKIYNHVTTHYGHAGLEFIKYLMKLGPENIRADVDAHRDRMVRTYNCVFGGEERFWEQAIVLADYAGYVAEQAGLIRFDYRDGTRAVLQQLGAMRQTVVDNRRDNYDILSEYLNEHVKQTLTLMYTGGSKGTPDYNNMPPGEVHLRYELRRKDMSSLFDRGVLYIDKVHLRRWMATAGYDFAWLMRDLRENDILVSIPHGKINMGRETSLRIGQCYAIGLDISHPKLSVLLNSTDATDELVMEKASEVIDMRSRRPK